MMVYFPANYSMHSNGEKWLYMRVNGDGMSETSATVGLKPEGSETANGQTFGFDLWMPGHPVQAVYPQPTTTTRIPKGRWVKLEVYMSMNSPGKSDGEYRAWLDGSLVHAVSNLNIRANATSQPFFDGIRFDGTRGGGRSDTPTPAAGQSRFYNRLAWYAAGP